MASMKEQLENIYGPVGQLEEDGILLVKNDPKITKIDYTIEINKLIKGRINDCKSFFPDWMSWDYVKNMFIMPNGTEEFGIKAAGDEFLANKNSAVSKNFIRAINENEMDVKALFRESVQKARTTLTKEQEESLYKKLQNRLEFQIDEDGKIIFRLK